MVEIITKHNIHTHTNLSDGSLSPNNLVKSASREGLYLIGICDHAFTSKIKPRDQVTERLEIYLEELRRIQTSHPDIIIKAGLEIDSSTGYGTAPADLPFDTLNQFDYLLFEYVHTQSESWGNVGFRDISELVAIRNKLQIPVGLAHNDLQKNFKGKEEELAKILADNNIFVEICDGERGRNNRDGMYYFEHFSAFLLEQLAKYDVRVAIGTDTHKSGNSLAETEKATEFIKKHGLKYPELIEEDRILEVNLARLYDFEKNPENFNEKEMRDLKEYFEIAISVFRERKDTSSVESHYDNIKDGLDATITGKNERIAKELKPLNDLKDRVAELEAELAEKETAYQTGVAKYEKKLGEIQAQIAEFKTYLERGTIPDPRRIAIRANLPGNKNTSFNRVFLETYMGEDLSAIPDDQLPKVTELGTFKTLDGKQVIAYSIFDQVVHVKNGKEKKGRMDVEILYLQEQK